MSSPEDGGGVPPRQMAHPSPKLAQTKRVMAHPVRRGPIWRVRRALAAPFFGRFVPKQRRGREVAVVLALLLVAGVISATLPGAWSRPDASPSGQLAANPVSPSDPSDTGSSPTSSAPVVTGSPSPAVTPTLAPTATPTAKPAADVRTFVTLGDSLTAWPAESPWPARLDTKDALLRLVHNAGVPGDLTSQMLDRVDRDVFAYNPKVLFILGGTNDLGKGVDPAITIGHLRSIIVAANKRKIHIFLLLLPPEDSTSMGKKIDSMNAAITHLGNSYRIVVINIHDVLSTSSGVYQKKYTSDGLHFSSLGAQTVTNVIYSRIHRLGY